MKISTKFLILLLGLFMLMDLGASDGGVFRNIVKRSADGGQQNGPPGGRPQGEHPSNGPPGGHPRGPPKGGENGQGNESSK